MTLMYPQPIQYEFTKAVAAFKQHSEALVKLYHSGGISTELTDREFLYMQIQRDTALLATMTAIGDTLEYLDFVKPPPAPGTVTKITIAPV